MAGADPHGRAADPPTGGIGRGLCIRAYPRIRTYAILSGQTSVSGHPGSANYPGRPSHCIRAMQSIRAVGREDISGQTGNEIYPG